MISLFKTNLDWGVYFIALVILKVSYFDISWFSFSALAVALYQFLLLFYSMGSVMPVRYLAGAMMCVQMLVGPALAYGGLDEYQTGYYKMQIPEADYFSYALPAVILFILGLHITAGQLKGEFIIEEKVRKYISQNKDLPYMLVGAGFVSSVVSSFFGSELGFVFILLGGLKFIGAFLLILGDRKMKPAIFILVYGSIIASSLRGAMFHDLLIWLIFLGAVFAIKYKPSLKVKAIFASGFVLLALIVQVLKTDYRKATWDGGQEGGLETFSNTFEERKENQGLFDPEKIASSNIRINQGYIVTNIMKTVPEKVPYEYGDELFEIIKAAVLPRFLAPDKLRAGDREIFIKYSGIPLLAGTSMGLSSLGDFYINYGVLGGIICMFFFGLLFSEILNIFYRHSGTYPSLLLFSPLLFYYPIRPDCELQTIMGHLFKSGFFLFIIFQIWKYKLMLKTPVSLDTDPINNKS